MMKMQKITQSYDMRVFTDAGEYFGDVEEAILAATKVTGWRVKASKNSALARKYGNVRGVIVPHNLVKAVGDIMIISNIAVPNVGDDDAASAE